MSVDIKIKNDDIVVESGKTKLTEGRNQIIQSLENRLLTRKGEYFLNINYGLDYDSVFSIKEKDPLNEIKILAMRECILQDDRISSVDRIEVAKKERVLEVYFECTLKTGDQITGGVELG